MVGLIFLLMAGLNWLRLVLPACAVASTFMRYYLTLVNSIQLLAYVSNISIQYQFLYLLEGRRFTQRTSNAAADVRG